mgnify:CR=1 FL=1
MKKRKTPIQGKGRQFRADLWLDEKITGRTMNALQMRGIKSVSYTHLTLPTT